MSWVQSIMAGVFAWFSFGHLPPDEVRWSMLNVSRPMWPADAHLIRLPDGRNFLIDAGNEGPEIVASLRARAIDVLHGVFISHPHKDHYGGLRSISDAGIKIAKVWFNQPDKALCNQEIPWGCDYAHVVSLMQVLKGRGVELAAMTPGMRLLSAPGTTLDVLYVFDGVNTPVGPTDINDTSALLMLKSGATRVLFSGDLNALIGGYLANASEDIRADILKVPHHGTEGLAPNVFFDRVDASLALIPSPGDLWMTSRSERVRTYFEEKQIPVYVNGFHGDVEVEFEELGFRVAYEKSPSVAAFKRSRGLGSQQGRLLYPLPAGRKKLRS